MADYEFKTLRAGGGNESNEEGEDDERSDRSDGAESDDLGLEEEEMGGAPMPQLREYGNTGPKGVLRDYAEAAERLQKRTEEKKKRLWQMAERNTFATTTVREDEEEENQEEGEEVDEELQRLRAQRLAQLKKQKQGQGPEEGPQRVCGSPYVERLGTYDYMRVVQEEAYADQLVAVLLHRDEALRGAGDALAAAYCALARHVAEEEGRDRDEVRFCAMGARDALDAFDDAGLPALLVYARGQLRDCAMALAGAPALQRAAQRFGLLDAGTALDVTNAARRHALFDRACDGVAGLQISDEEEEDDDYNEDEDEEEDS